MYLKYKMSSKNHKKDYFPFDVYIDNENFKKFIIFGYKIINKELDKGEKLFLNISLNKYVNAKLKRLFITSSQLKKLLKNPIKLIKLSFSRTQINKTFLNVMNYTFSSDKLKILNHYFSKQSTKDRLETLKKENAKKAKQLKKLKLQDQLKTSKKENAKEAKKLKSLKSKQGKIILDTFVQNTLKKYKEPKPKKKKSIWDVIEIPKPLVI